MESVEDIIRLSAAAPVGPAAIVSLIVIPTRNRPAEIARAIKSYSANSIQFGRTPRFLISDDSEICSRQAIESVAKSAGAQIIYSGPAQKKEFASALSEASGVDPALVDFALFGQDGIAAMGANRNRILLQTAGTAILSVDDDTVCRTGRMPQTDPATLRMGKPEDPTDFWFCPSLAAVESLVEWQDLDVVGEHERFLGRTLPNLVGGWEREDLNIGQACDHILGNLSRGEGRVLVTYNGVAGDSALHSGRALHLRLSSCGTRHRLTASDAAFRTAIDSRQVVRHTPEVVVGHFAPCVGMCIGLDNRELLPPFFPVGRNEDGVFGKMMERCVPGAHAAHLPWAILHCPPGQRSYDTRAGRNRLTDLVAACLESWPEQKPPDSTAESLQSLGRHMEQLTESGPDGFAEFLLPVLRRAASMHIQYQEKVLRKFGGEPVYWADGIRRQIAAIRIGMEDPAFGVPCDVEFAEGPEAGVHSLVRSFGRLLQSWEALVGAAKQLRLDSC